MEARVPLTRRARGAFSAVAALGVVAFAHPARAAEPTKTQCIDANEAAQPLRKSGKLRAAEERLLVCVRATCPAVVRDDCAQRLTEVRAAEPTVVFVVKDESEHDLTGVRVTMDGVELATKLDGTAIAVDPGEHHFAFEVEGRLKEERTLMLNEGDRGRQERIVLVSPVVETTTPAPPPKPPEPEPSAEGAPPPPGRTQRQIGIALGGVGLAGVVVSSIFGIAAKNLYDHAVNTECGPSVKFMSATECLPNGITDSNAAHNYATGSTVGFVVSGALLAAGATLYFMAPRGVSVTVAPTVGAGGAGLGVGGGW
jgi:hypothetical protein